MTDQELGQAHIVYDDPHEGVTETTVDNEHVAYFDDHWFVKTGEDDDGNDVVRRIPRDNVYYVERSVEEFKEQMTSMADELKQRVGLDE